MTPAATNGPRRAPRRSQVLPCPVAALGRVPQDWLRRVGYGRQGVGELVGRDFGKPLDAIAGQELRRVADELERRWEATLQRVEEVEQRIRQHTARTNGQVVADAGAWQHLAEDLERVWHDPACDARVKKRIVRTLIREVVADVDVAAGEIMLVIHWQGGVHTELRVPRRRRGRHGHETAKDIVAAVRVLARVCADKDIAGLLQRNGLHTGKGNRGSWRCVTATRSPATVWKPAG